MKYLIALSLLLVSKLSVSQNTFPASGYVGIGTTSPTSNLTINGTGTIGAEILTDGTSSSRPVLTFQRGIGFWNIGMNMDVGNTNNFHFRYNGTTYPFTIQAATGNVGVGTTIPNFKLEIVANNQLAIGKTYVDNCQDANNGYVRSNFGSNVFWDGTNHLWQVKAIGANDFSAIIHPSNDGLAFVTGSSDANASKSLTNSQFMAYERMRINANGNVGIGTTSPDAKLAVSGQIHAQEVKVSITVPGPDYVFNKDYKLASLEEIKNYIDQNKHLPEVPSAKEMEKNGVQLGEMNMLLLKKIEELTLHMIELKKENENQRLAIEKLNDQILKK